MKLEHIQGKSVNDLSPAARKVLNHEKVDLDHLTDRLSGRGDGLRTSKPTANGDTGLEQYVWRMARFHSGADPSMPVTAAWDLDNWLESQGIDAKVSGIRGESGKEIEAILGHVMAQLVTAKLGHNPEVGFGRWEKAIHG